MNRGKETNFMQVKLNDFDDDDSSSSYGSSDEDEIDEIYDNYEGQGDIKFQLGQPNIKTTSRKIGDQAMWDLFEDNPPEVDSGSAAAMVWTRRFEKMMLIIAYVGTFIVVLFGALVNKGLTLFMTAQISVRNNRTLAFCNKDRLIADDTKQFELRRERFEGENLKPDQESLADDLETEQVAWIWCLIFAFAFPEVFTFLRSSRKVFLRKDYSHNKLVGTQDYEVKEQGHSTWPTLIEFFFVFLMETVHVIGLVILTFIALPQMDTAHAIVLTNCVGFGPALFRVLNFGNSPNDSSLTRPVTKKIAIFSVDCVALFMQLSGALAWPILEWTDNSTQTSEMMSAWALPVGLLMTSFGWWESFVPENEEKSNGVLRTGVLHLFTSPLSWMQDLRKTMISYTRYSTYLILSIWKMGLFFGTACGVSVYYGLLREPRNLVDKFTKSFGVHNYTVSEVVNVVEGMYRNEDGGTSSEDIYEDWDQAILQTLKNSPLKVLLIQILCGYLTYILGKFACKVKIQEFSFSAPLCAIVPIAATLILSACGARAKDQCAFNPVIPEYLFFECPDVGDFWEYLWNEQIWLWSLWYLSQIWISRHIWQPMSDKLASTEQMFGTPYYCGLLVDQSIVFNRRRDGCQSAKFRAMLTEKHEMKKAKQFQKFVPGAQDGQAALEVMNQRYGGNASGVLLGNKGGVSERDKVTRIYGCSTMWHENAEEMMEYLKSVFRVDIDYSKRRLAQKYFGVNDPDYYEWETHIFFDDAFKKGPPDAPDEKPVNVYVKYLISSMDEAASHVHCRNVKIKPPRKIPTPYGGRLVWTLPGKTKIVAHLKDKSKIRNKKRWSQVMYMYYLLGFKLVDNLKLNDAQKEMRAQNTYLLALDGDIDFQAEAITRLVDKMKKNQNLGAACGRILPTGSGFMVWYQKFEYAIGHWLQKSTEHVMGCVLCSPGCFSLFRGRALMDANVMRRYTTNPTQPRHFVQYDQGEDRWLCTLILMQGWRIEYCAASDSYTAAPTAFNEFFNQRRRWMPSTIANIFDLLQDYKHVCESNPDISVFYIMYQSMIMVGTVLGPGTIFLMLVGALQAAFKYAFWDAFLFQLFPIIGFMMVCQYFKKDVQLIVAQVLTMFYVLVMMAVLVGILLQMSEDGLLSPSALGIWLVGGSFVLSAIMHPQEFWCLPYGLIYYVTIPSMYLLLVIFAIYNLNDVSWGTREVAADAVPTKNEEEEKKKAEETAKKAKEAKKSEGGLIGFLMESVGANGGGKGDKGGIDFSLANLCRCMCFTHEDTDASDSKTQLIKIAASLEDVAGRLSKIEEGIPGVSNAGAWAGRRKSSMRRSLRSSRLGSYNGPSLSPVPSEDLAGGDHESLSSHQGARSSLSSPMVVLPMEDPEEITSEEEEESNDPPIQRDDLRNPFWIEDKEVLNGPRGHLKMDEIEFWKELIPKYLESFEKKFANLKEKQDDEKEKENNKIGLRELRDQMVFSVFMLNAIFVVIVALVQQEKETLSFDWFFPKETNGTFVEYIDGQSFPTVKVERVFVTMDPIGFVFLFFFAIVIVVQVIGMLFHRWETISHIISDTKLPWVKSMEAEEEDDFDYGDEDTDVKGNGRRRSSLHPSDMLAVTGELMKEGTFKLERKDSTVSNASVDSITKRNTEMNSGFQRRKTIKDMKKDFTKNKGDGAFIDLEKNFRKQLDNLDPNAFEKSNNPALRRLSTRRGTINALEARRKSLGLGVGSRQRSGSILKEEDENPSDIYGVRPRHSSVRDKEGFSNMGFLKEIDEVGDDEIDSVLEGSNIGSAYSRNSEQFEYVDDKRPSSSDSGNVMFSSHSGFNSRKQPPPPPPI